MILNTNRSTTQITTEKIMSSTNSSICSADTINRQHHQKMLQHLNKTNSLHHNRRTNERKNKNKDSCTMSISKNHHNKNIQHLRDLHIISWNVNGGLDPKYNDHELIINHINNYPSTTIILAQETTGIKGGYTITPQSRISCINNMNLVASDHHGITAIYVHQQCHSYTPITFPQHIYQHETDTINHIHATAITLQINEPIRSRHEITIFNIYMSPNSNKSTINQLTTIT